MGRGLQKCDYEIAVAFRIDSSKEMGSFIKEGWTMDYGLLKEDTSKKIFEDKIK